MFVPPLATQEMVPGQLSLFDFSERWQSNRAALLAPMSSSDEDEPMGMRPGLGRRQRKDEAALGVFGDAALPNKPLSFFMAGDGSSRRRREARPAASHRPRRGVSRGTW